MFIVGRKKLKTLRSDKAAEGSLARALLNQRMEKAIESTMNMRVIREDMLGEGEGAWDSDPRYPTDTVNCIIWLQLLISEVYGYGLCLEEKTKIMDRVRYYGGHPAYGLRKCHYIDQWLKLEPEPLQPIKLYKYKGFTRGQVTVEKERLKEFHNYTCNLYREDLRTFDIDYVTAEGLTECVAELKPGFYIGFGVASRYYLNLYGTKCGPMGLVHALVIKVTGAVEGGGVAAQLGSNALVYHASIVSNTVDEHSLPDYLERAQKLFVGYAIFELNPAWDFTTPCFKEESMQQILLCEATLPRTGEHREL